MTADSVSLASHAMLSEAFATDELIREGDDDPTAPRYRWCQGLGWLRWDGVSWRPASEPEVVEVARQFLLAKFSAYVGVGDNPRNWASLLYSPCIRATEALARGIATIDHSALDGDPEVLNTPGGVFDLRTGELSPCTPESFHTKVTRAVPVLGSHSALWTGFLERVLPDPEVRGYLQRVIGLSLLGEVREHLMPILTGVGANGKSVFRDAIMHALGDYATEVDPKILIASKHSRHATFLMQLRGRRLVFVSETDQKAAFAESEMKRLVGGDPIEANLMHRDPIVFLPSHSIALVTNNLPDISDDPAVWRRISVVPFDVVIPEQERDGRLGGRLKAEAPAILGWALQGYSDYLAGGLRPPAAVQATTQEYRNGNDTIARFIEEQCRKGPGLTEGASVLYQAYATWCRQNMLQTVTSREFPKVLSSHGIGQKKTAQGMRFLGLTIPATDALDVLHVSSSVF
jgi:putative DNA primase/helicase